MSIEDYVKRIERGLERAANEAGKFTSGAIDAELKEERNDPVTAADLAIDKVLREELLRDGEGWLSEETVDDKERLDKEYVWIVDPLDGTREFVEGIDEWCISIGLCRGGRPVAGGICNPSRGETFIGWIGGGVLLNGRPVGVTARGGLDGATVLASRSEVKRGQWEQFADSPFEVIAMGSVAYKLARVSAGLDDATFTLVPKSEWDIAAGVCLVQAAGGKVLEKNGAEFTFNNSNVKITGLVASGSAMFDELFEAASKGRV